MLIAPGVHQLEAGAALRGQIFGVVARGKQS